MQASEISASNFTFLLGAHPFCIVTLWIREMWRKRSNYILVDCLVNRRKVVWQSQNQARSARVWSNVNTRPVHLGMCIIFYYNVWLNVQLFCVCSKCDWQALRYLGCVSSEHRRWTHRADLSKWKGKKPSRDTLIALWKNMMLSHSCRNVVC